MEKKYTKIQIPSEFKALFEPQWRHIVYYGGRGSLKSHSVARSLLIRGRKDKLRILCTRELQKSIKDSVHKLLADLIGQYELKDYVIKKDSIINTVTGTEFIFLGLRLNVLEIKSLEGIDVCWVEEAQAITNESIDVLTPTIRKSGSQIIWTYNRINELDPVHVKFVINKPPNTYVKKVDYKLAESLGWFPDVLKAEMEEDKKTPAIYQHKWLGEPLSQSDKSIISRTSIMEAMQRTIADDGAVEYGVDVARMGNDRTVFWKVKGLKTMKFKIHQHKRTTEVCDLLEQFVDYNKSDLIKIDDTGVGGGVTDEMIRRGYNIQPINFGGEPDDKDKYPNWISEAWFYMGSVMTEAELPMNSDLIMELSTRQWKQDTRGRRGVESKQEYKKRGFRSPDLADACIIAYSKPNKKLLTIADISL